MRYRLAIFLLIALLIPLQFSLWGKDGWFRLKNLTQFIAEQRRENEQMKQRNRLLMNEADDLKSGSAAMEELAREKLEMIKRDEVLFRLIRHSRDSE